MRPVTPRLRSTDAIPPAHRAGPTLWSWPGRPDSALHLVITIWQGTR